MLIESSGLAPLLHPHWITRVTRLPEDRLLVTTLRCYLGSSKRAGCGPGLLDMGIIQLSSLYVIIRHLYLKLD